MNLSRETLTDCKRSGSYNLRLNYKFFKRNLDRLIEVREVQPKAEL